MMRGLTESEVRDSRDKHGSNSITRQERKTFMASFLANFGDPIIKVLLAALAINVIFLMRNADWLESFGIATAILLATLVATISEHGSETAFEKLQEEASRISVRVRRDGVVAEIALGDIVVGDIVLLQAGERIPADGVMVEGQLEVDQSALNGESKEAKKFASVARTDKRDLMDSACVFAGTIVMAGEGLMRVEAVGDATFYGGMAIEMQEETRESPLKVRLGNFARTISKFGYTAAAMVAAVYLLHNWMSGDIHSWGSLFRYMITAATIAVSIIVMAVPEGLPMMITVVLSTNMKKMLADKVLVRKLVGIETAGSLNILFTDKTGTLTKGKLEVACFVDERGVICERMPAGLHECLVCNTSATMNDEGMAIGGNSTDRALLEFGCNLGEVGAVEKVGCLPFSSEQKFMATTVRRGGECVTLIKGAPERILPLCGNANVHALEQQMRRLAKKAMRVVAIATGRVPIGEKGNLEALGRLELVGLLGIRDEVRDEASAGVRRAQDAGIQVVMITGDSKATAEAIAKDTGIIRDELREIVLTSSEMSGYSDSELAEILPDLRVVARALPTDKSRLVRVAQGMDLVVGMTGDGVNDAPALKRADVGFAMGSGTEVAKEAGDIIILDDNVSSIVQAISYGRAIFKNIRKFIIYQLTVSMGAVGISILGPFIGIEHPVTVIQMLWINIVMDTLAGLAFSGERARAAYMKEAPKRRDEAIVTGEMWNQIVICAGWIAFLCFAFLRVPVIHGAFMGRGEGYMLTGFFALFMMTAIFMGFCARTASTNLFSHILGNKGFLVIMGSVAVAQTVIVYIGGGLFRTSGLDVQDFLLVVAMAATIIPVDIIRKKLYGQEQADKACGDAGDYAKDDNWAGNNEHLRSEA